MTADSVERFEAAQEHVLQVYGLAASRRFVDVASIDERAQVLDVGDGPVLFFVIGGGAPAAMWAPLLAELDGYRRIAVDRPGFGLTPRVPHNRHAMRELAVDFLSGVLDELDLAHVTVVANSMGAWWSTQLAVRQPDRIEAMIQIGCPALLLDTSAPFPMRLLGVRGLGRLLMRLQAPSLRQARRTYEMMGDPLGTEPADQAMARLLEATTKLPAYAPTWLELLHAFVRVRGQQPGMGITAADLRQLAMPLLYVWGEGDPFGSPEAGRRAAQIAPQATLVTVPHGHVPWVSDAAAVAAPIRRFLRASAPAPEVESGRLQG